MGKKGEGFESRAPPSHSRTRVFNGLYTSGEAKVSATTVATSCMDGPDCEGKGKEGKGREERVTVHAQSHCCV